MLSPRTDLVIRPRFRVLMVNPNTSELSTGMMLRAAREEAGADLAIDALTASFGSSLITDEDALDIAADALMAAVAALDEPMPDALIIAAFGDPGLAELQSMDRFDVVGIAEASMGEAAVGGRRFSVATTTPKLASAIRRCAERYGVAEQFMSVRITDGDPERVMGDSASLLAALEKASRAAIDQDGAEAIIIGGGPLADAARDLAGLIGVPVIQPIPAAVRLLRARLYRQPAAPGLENGHG